MYIQQKDNIKLKHVKKSVDWLVLNTTVDVFDPLTFSGYQRQIDKGHCEKIIKYIENDFILPTSIICATDQDYSENTTLRIVDGQHRVEAFKILKDQNPSRYFQIKDYEMSIIIMERVDKIIEIETFITINKTSKKVDTSLAFVLKNKINNSYKSTDLGISKREYLSVELAQMLNEKSQFWKDKILFEGNVKNSPEFISLNAFVRSTRTLLGTLEAKGIIELDWENREEITVCLEKLNMFFDFIWNSVQKKWSGLFDNENKRTIIQGAIGFSSLNKFVSQMIRTNCNHKDLRDVMQCCREVIMKIDVPISDWEPGGRFSKFTSESGYSLVAKELENSAMF